MKSYYRVMLGKGSVHADEAVAGGFIGTDFTIKEDLAEKLPDEWRQFNEAFIPIFLKNNPHKTRIGAGLAMGALWTVSKGIQVGDIVLCPDGERRYHVAEVTGNYKYVPGDVLPHRRPVRWLGQTILRANMSEPLLRSTRTIGTVCEVTAHAADIERLLGRIVPPVPDDVEDQAAFALEKHLEDFLVENWRQTELGRDHDIYEEEGEPVGQQYETDTGPIDVLAISKDKKRLLVVELKRGRASDAVVGQVLRYMGYVRDELAEDGQEVRGAIIALEVDQRLRRALSMAKGIDFYRYQVGFKLHKA